MYCEKCGTSSKGDMTSCELCGNKLEKNIKDEDIEVKAGLDFTILLGFIPYIVIGLIVWMVMNVKLSDYENDCIIGRDSPDCLSGSYSHPLGN